MSGSHSRTKGHSYEREIAKFYRELGFPAKRTLQSREGFEGSDVTGVPWWVECKRYARIGIMKWWRQARGDAEKDGQGLQPVLHIKEDHGEELVVLSLNHWKSIVLTHRP